MDAEQAVRLMPLYIDPFISFDGNPINQSLEQLRILGDSLMALPLPSDAGLLEEYLDPILNYYQGRMLGSTQSGSVSPDAAPIAHTKTLIALAHFMSTEQAERAARILLGDLKEEVMKSKGSVSIDNQSRLTLLISGSPPDHGVPPHVGPDNGWS
jgi:hypothetical protein